MSLLKMDFQGEQTRVDKIFQVIFGDFLYRENGKLERKQRLVLFTSVLAFKFYGLTFTSG